MPVIGWAMPASMPDESCPGWANATAGERNSAKVYRALRRFMEAPFCVRKGKSGCGEQALFFDKGDDFVQALADFLVAEYKGLVATHLLGVALHHFQRGTHHWRQVDLVDHQQVRFADAWAAFARQLVASRDVDDVQGQVRQFRAERRRQ